MSNEHIFHGNRGEPEMTPPGSTRAIAFERLIDQLTPGADYVPPAIRAARRLCGRWLLLRRAARELSYAQVAERTGLSEGAIELLEQGLLGPALGSEESWFRLRLVLEHHVQHDLPRVAAVIELARGAAAGLDAAMLADLEAELAVPEEAAPAPRPQVKITRERIDILAAARALGRAATAYEVKKAIAEVGGKSWNPADLPRAMAGLSDDGLLSRTSDLPASYALTPAGAEILDLAEQREREREAARQAQEAARRAQEAARRAEAAIASLDHRISDFAGRLKPLSG